LGKTPAQGVAIDLQNEDPVAPDGVAIDATAPLAQVVDEILHRCGI
jgi:hypothetical protein